MPQGLARNYSNVTLAAGPQAINVALGAESAVSGSVSLSDGQAIQSIVCILAVLQGNEPIPYFSGAITSTDFVLGSLPPGTYDFSIVSPDYTPALISNVQIGQGQTVNLGTVQLERPKDSQVTWRVLEPVIAYRGVTGNFADLKVNPVLVSRPMHRNEYFKGIGVPTQHTQTATNILY